MVTWIDRWMDRKTGSVRKPASDCLEAFSTLINYSDSKCDGHKTGKRKQRDRLID